MITALNQGTKEANACELVYEELRDTLLSMHNWNFAEGRVKLAQLSDAPTFGYKYAYALPADFLRATRVFSNSQGRGTVRYKIEGEGILSDASELYMKYVRRISDPNKMIPLFRVALSKMIAARLAVALSQSTSLRAALTKEFDDTDLPRAQSADSVQDFPDELPESTWVSVRYGNHYHDEVSSIEGVD